MAQITEVGIQNFDHIGEKLICKGLVQENMLAGLFVTAKKSFAKAVFFGLGASMKQLSVKEYGDLKNSQDRPMSVILTLIHRRQCHTVERVLRIDNVQQFLVNKRSVDEGTYYEHMRGLKIDLSKQMLFCDSTNISLLCNMLATEPLYLIGVITGRMKETTATIQQYRTKSETLTALDRLSKFRSQMDECTDKLKKVLPESAESYAEEFAFYTSSELKREETERMARKAELVAAQNELSASNAEIQNFKATIAGETELRDQKVQAEQAMLEQIRQVEATTDGEDCVLVLDSRKSVFQRSLQQVRLRIKAAENPLVELERLKNEAESNVAFMNGASGTKRKSDMIPKEYLLIPYLMSHRSDKLEMAKLELQLLKKQSDLNAIKNQRETFDFMERILPKVERKEMFEPETIKKIFADLDSAFRDLTNPQAYMKSNDELNLKKLRSLIPSDKGFLLNGTFRANDAQYQNLIGNILDDYKYTIALFKDDQKSIFDNLKKEYSEWYKNVKFLVLSELPNPSSPMGYIAPTDHWLNYCTFTHTNIEEKFRRKLMLYMGKQLDIICVPTHDDVKREFRNKSKKYVASIDGELIYGRSSMGIDVIKYIRLGKKVKDMQFPAVCERYETAIKNYYEFASTITDTENVPRVRPDFNTAAMESEVNLLEQAMAESKQRMNCQMDALHLRCNAPYEAPEVQNYANALAAEQRRLDNIIGRITAAQNDIARLRGEEASLERKIDGLTKFIQLTEQTDKNAQDIVKHNKVIKESDEQITKLNKTVARLQLTCRNLLEEITCLKYKTVKTVCRAHQERIDWTSVDCRPEPQTLWQDIQNGIYIDPLEISINFHEITDTVDPDVFYASRNWYAARDRCQEKETELTNMTSDIREKLTESQEQYNRLQAIIKSEFTKFCIDINQLLKDICAHAYPDLNGVYDISFDFDELMEGKSVTFKLKIDGDDIEFKSLNKLHRMRASWLLFAALSQYSEAPFVFIDLEGMNEMDVRLIHSVVRRMPVQKFIDASSPLYSELAMVHYGMKPRREHLGVQVVRHDGTKFVIRRHLRQKRQITIMPTIEDVDEPEDEDNQ